MNYTVLIVDDDLNLLEGLERLLHREPYQIVTAQSAQDAMEILQEQPVDVIVSDQEMPGLKGTQFLWKVRKIYPDIILFMLTGQATPHMAKLAINEIGIARFFTKPCNAVDLALAIRQALQHRELAISARRLLEKVHRQDAILRQLAQTAPEILHNARKNVESHNTSGEIPADEQELIQALRQTLEDTHPHTPDA